MLNILIAVSLITSFQSIYTFSQPVVKTNTVDTQLGRDNILDCPINRTNWPSPSILQWYRSVNNYSIPIASQFDDFPVHIDDPYANRFTLLSNGSLKIINIHLNDNDSYECRLILIDRGILDTKEAFRIILRVNEPPRLINRSSSLQIATHYSNVEFFCQVYGVPHPIVKWYKIIDQDKIKTNEDESQPILTISQNLVLKNVDDRMAGKYKCIAENQLGSIENEFKLLIQGSIYWKEFPQNQTVKINASISLRCEGESSEPLQYRWFKDDVSMSEIVASQHRIRTYSDGLLIIDHIQPFDHGSYVCLISTLNGTSARSKPVHVTVRYPPVPSSTRPPKNLTLIRGSLGICPCLLDAYPPIESVSWYRNNKAVRLENRASNYRINPDYALVIKSVSARDNGIYFCRAQNSEGFGHDGLPFSVEIKDPIQFIHKPNTTYTVQERSRLILPCSALGYPKPTIKWFKNNEQLDSSETNLTFQSITKNDHGLYICQASNQYTTANASTLVIVQNTTPQAPFSIDAEQISSNLFISWEAGYDGGHQQHFYLWYRLGKPKKQNWKQIRVLPENATDCILFDLEPTEVYEILIVAENKLGLGAFSTISSVFIQPTKDRMADYVQFTNETKFIRPPPPNNLYLSLTGSNLYASWQHPDLIDSQADISFYVLQWRSNIFFNSQQSHQSTVLLYPTNSFVIKDVKQARYSVQLLAYTHQGIYSTLLESEIDIELHPILLLYASNTTWICILSFLTFFTLALLCMGIFMAIRYHYQRRFYWTDLGSGDNMSRCCFASIHYKPGECSQIKNDRCQTNSLKSKALPESPMYITRHRKQHTMHDLPILSAKLELNASDPSVALIQVDPSQGCVDTINVHSHPGNPSLVAHLIPIENFQVFTTSRRVHNDFSSMIEQEIPTEHLTQVNSIDIESKMTNLDSEIRKNSVRSSLETVPEQVELKANRKMLNGTTSKTSGNIIMNQSHQNGMNAVLTTFDSASLQRRR